MERPSQISYTAASVQTASAILPSLEEFRIVEARMNEPGGEFAELIDWVFYGRYGPEYLKVTTVFKNGNGFTAIVKEDTRTFFVDNLHAIVATYSTLKAAEFGHDYWVERARQRDLEVGDGTHHLRCVREP
jgi:hypothetical protein